MASETVKKRGRPKKVVSLEEEVIVVEQSSKEKPRTSTTKKPTRKDADEPASSTKRSIKNSENAAKIQSPVNGGANGRNVAATSLPNSDAAKQDVPSTARSAILQKATAFKTAAEPAALANSEVPKFSETDQTTVESPIEVLAVESNAPVANFPTTIQEQKPSNSIKEWEPQLDAAEDVFGAGVQEVKSKSPNASAATTINEVDQAPTLQDSVQESAAPMSNTSPSSSPSDKEAPSIGPIKNTRAASSPLNSEPTSAILPKVSSKPSPRLPSSFAPAPAPPPPLRPTQLPYHELKKNPEFKALSRKYTSLIIAIPIALFTSYVLWGRCEFWLDVFGP
jgi:hypothetical protein